MVKAADKSISAKIFKPGNSFPFALVRVVSGTLLRPDKLQTLHITGAITVGNGTQSANSSFNFLGVQRSNNFSTPSCSSPLVHAFPLTMERKTVSSNIQQSRLKEK